MSLSFRKPQETRRKSALSGISKMIAEDVLLYMARAIICSSPYVRSLFSWRSRIWLPVINSIQFYHDQRKRTIFRNRQEGATNHQDMLYLRLPDRTLMPFLLPPFRPNMFHAEPCLILNWIDGWSMNHKTIFCYFDGAVGKPKIQQSLMNGLLDKSVLR